MENKTKIIVVAGPTASGKTALGIEIAKAVNGEIVSADSMQVYKGMSIATAAPTKAEKAQVPHHLVEFLDRSESFSVSQYCDLARAEINDIVARQKTPIIVGGTGLFIDSLVDNVKFLETEPNFKLRQSLMSKTEDELYEELSALDPEAARAIHKNNKSRVARALEIYYLTGKTKSFQNENSKLQESPFNTLYLVLTFSDRQILYDRINARVDKMLDTGLLEEAESVLNGENRGTSVQAIGHKELEPYFKGEISLDEAVDNLKKQTRHYAKRQITWFNRREGAVKIVADNFNDELIKSTQNLAREFIYG